MLPSATVGTLGLRSLVEPVRRIIDQINGHFLKASAVDVDFSGKLVEVSQVGQDGQTKNFYPGSTSDRRPKVPTVAEGNMGVNRK
jgi:NADH dehydrogenase